MGLIDTTASEIWYIAFLQQASDPATIATRWQLYAKSGGFYQKDLAGAVLRLLTSADLSGLSGTYQPLDADLTALAALASTGFARQAGAGSWSIVGETGSANVVRATSPTIVTPTIAKLANLTTNGVLQASGGDGTLSTYKPTLFVQTASVTVTNTTTETTLVGAGQGSMTLPANLLTVGSWLRLTVQGYYSTHVTTPGAMRQKFKIGGQLVGDTGGVAATANMTNRWWIAELLVICRSVGASGTVLVEGRVHNMNANVGSQTREMTEAALVPFLFTVDTTGTLALDFTHQWSTVADTTNIFIATQLLLQYGAAA